MYIQHKKAEEKNTFCIENFKGEAIFRFTIASYMYHPLSQSIFHSCNLTQPTKDYRKMDKEIQSHVQTLLHM